jgi:DUF1680 family protein
MDGFVGHLDELAPELMINDKIYGENRLSNNSRSKNVGNLQGQDEWSIQYLWWNSESQSNWRDGYLRHAFLLNDTQHTQCLKEYIDYILSTQDQDGYIGIYAPDLRYHFDGENGELWSKTTLYRVLLAYYDATKNEEVLKAVVRAVDNVMQNYPANLSTPFLANKPYAGIAHGLMFTDILDQLYQITNEKKYQDYALFLYRDYSSHEVSEKDVQLKNIRDTNYKHTGHGVHTYEHIRSLASAFFASGDKELEQALAIYLQRIDATTTLSGGPIGDEWILGREAHATNTGYEYCSIQELMDSYLFLLQKTGDFYFADKVEKIFFNAAQGARHPGQSSIAYLKTDNSFEMSGAKNGEKNSGLKQTRYKYSPVHQDVAVCCSPNAGRITPYYIEHMWMKGEEGIVICLLGPCEGELEWNNKRIRIREITSYPFSFSFNFEVTVDESVDFSLKIRKPSWSKRITANLPFEETEDYITIRKQWKGSEKFSLSFDPALEIHETLEKEVYFSFGPLVLAAPIEAIERQTKEYAIPGFCDTHYKAAAIKEYEYNKGKIEKKAGELVFEAELFNRQNQKKETVSLIPMGKTILRQVSFKKNK